MLVCRAGGQGFDSYGLNNSTGLKTTKTLKKDLPLPCERLLELRVAQMPGGGVLPYMGYMGMCRCEGYGFQAVYSRIGYINHVIKFEQ